MTRQNTRPKRPLTVVWRPLEELRTDPGHPRSHSKRQIRQIAKSLETFDFNTPILTDANGVVISGAGRLLAASQVGFVEVPTLQLDHLSPSQAKAFAIAENRLGELSKWDDRLLAERLQNLTAADLDFDLDAIGFDAGEIDFRIESLAFDQVPLDDAADRFESSCRPAKTAPGDIWELGDHRLACSDLLDADSIDRLMAGQHATIVFTDPPYNVPIDGHVSGKGSTRHREFAMGTGEMTSLEFVHFLTRACKMLARHSTNGSIHFVCMDWAHSAEILEAGKNVFTGGLKNICVWVKHNAGMGSLYRSQHEFVFVFKSGKAKHQNNIQLGRNGRHRTNIWSYSGMSSIGRESEEADLHKLHPTVKPVKLIADSILDCSARGDIVLDGFIGSGSTIIAAERTARRCYGVEIDPIYVDAAVRRWQTYSGGRATLLGSGALFGQ
jgi:DNA modification methylase